MASQPLIKTKGLLKHFRSGKQTIYALNGIDLEIYPGETLALVGESGSGKSTLGKTLIRLIEPTAGEVFFDSLPLHAIKKKTLKSLRKDMQMIFQDPYASLNPRMTVEDIIGEGLDIHNIAKGRERRSCVEQLLEQVGLTPDCLFRYPHEFSGGQRQRIGIARALAPRPRFIVCDEPISALDLSIQAQVINLLQQLKQQMSLTYLFITHNLAMVRYLADRVGVLYLGHLVEWGSNEAVMGSPGHPYTQALLSAIPVADPIAERKRQRIVLTGEIPSPLKPPCGCPLVQRCPLAMRHCSNEMPLPVEVKPGHFVACHLASPSQTMSS